MNYEKAANDLVGAINQLLMQDAPEEADIVAERALQAAAEEARAEERESIEQETRRYASHYPEASDGRNTFIMLAEWIAGRALSTKGRP